MKTNIYKTALAYARAVKIARVFGKLSYTLVLPIFLVFSVFVSLSGTTQYSLGTKSLVCFESLFLVSTRRNLHSVNCVDLYVSIAVRKSRRCTIIESIASTATQQLLQPRLPASEQASYCHSLLHTARHSAPCQLATVQTFTARYLRSMHVDTLVKYIGASCSS